MSTPVSLFAQPTSVLMYDMDAATGAEILTRKNGMLQWIPASSVMKGTLIQNVSLDEVRTPGVYSLWNCTDMPPGFGNSSCVMLVFNRSNDLIQFVLDFTKIAIRGKGANAEHFPATWRTLTLSVATT